ncbi:hypothetical protein ACFXGE_43805, partial [Streptomyces sp. NPDC059378]
AAQAGLPVGAGGQHPPVRGPAAHLRIVAPPVRQAPGGAARAATDLAAMRHLDWPVPAGIDGFLDLLQMSGALPGGGR